VAFSTDSFEGIGVTNQVTVSDPGALACAGRMAREEVAALDLACSRFRDDSELAALNRAAGRALEVSPLLLDAVETALYAAVRTDGLVDPTVGGAMRGIGYDRDFAVVVSRGDAPSFALVPAGGWRDILVDHERRLVTVPRGFELDLGATAKALAADRIATAVREATGSDVLVSLGGDVSIQGAPGGGWPIRVTDSHRNADDPGAEGPSQQTPRGQVRDHDLPPGLPPGQTVALPAGGLATSSTTVRRWTAGGIERHHVVDPVTGAPAIGPWRTVSVVAETCVAANAASTAAIVLGARAVEWLESRGLHARLVHRDGTVAVTGGWPLPNLTEDSQGARRPLRSDAAGICA
jgi:thiamine biosynthesis lipoprotein